MTDFHDPQPTAAPAAAPPADNHRARRIVSMVLVVLAAITIPLASTAVWATRTVLNDARFTATVSDVISDPGVITVVSTKITDEAFDALDNSQIIQQQLPPALQPVAKIVSGALRSRLEGRVEEVLASETGQNILTAAVRRAHARAMKVLQGGGLLSSDALSVQNGVVTLDLLPVIRQVLLRLQADGVIPNSVSIPAEGEPPGKLATAIKAKLPDDFGQIVVYRTDAAKLDGTLEQAQRALVVLKRSVVLLVIVAVAFAVAAVLVAVDRRRAVYRLGLGVSIGALVLIVVARRSAAAAPNAASTQGGRTIAAALADSLRSSLVRALLILLIIAVVTAAVARTWHGLVTLIATHQDIARIVAVALGLLILVVLGLGWGSVIFAVVVVALGLFAVQLAARETLSPSLPTPPTLTT